MLTVYIGIYLIGCVLSGMVSLASFQLNFPRIAKDGSFSDLLFSILISVGSYITLITSMSFHKGNKLDLIHFYTKGYWRIWWKNLKGTKNNRTSQLEKYVDYNGEK